MGWFDWFGGEVCDAIGHNFHQVYSTNSYLCLTCGLTITFTLSSSDRLDGVPLTRLGDTSEPVCRARRRAG